MADDPELARVARQLASIGRIDKCRGCSCYVDTVREFRDALRREDAGNRDALAKQAEELLRDHPETHGCFGCDPCYPVAVSNRLFERTASTADHGLALPLVDPRRPRHSILEVSGWPVVPGEYVVGNVRAPVAVSTLGSPELVPRLVGALGLREIAIVGKTETENLGVEKIVGNVVANPAIRALILCGAEAQGHRPGATLLALARNGVDAEGQVIGSPGRRPLLKNVREAEIARFREQVEIIDLIGEGDPEAIRRRIAEETTRSRAPLGPWRGRASVPPEDVGPPPPWIPDPRGYFVISLDRLDGRIVLEFYAYDGSLLGTLRAPAAKPLYHEAIRRGWLSRLDHAAYLGRELARAQEALESGERYIQDAA